MQDILHSLFLSPDIVIRTNMAAPENAAISFCLLFSRIDSYLVVLENVDISICLESLLKAFHYLFA